MAWDDDSWKDGYDAWKLRDPIDYADEPDEPCWHEEYDADLLTGEATCVMCGHRWTQTDDEIKAEAQRIADHDEAMRRYEFRVRWLGWWDRARSAVSRWRGQRKRPPLVIDDELPF